MGLSVAIAIIGIAVARYFYSPQARDSRYASKAPSSRCTSLLYNKWYVDEIYDFLFVNGLVQGRRTACSAPSTATWWMAASTAPAG